MIYDKLNLFNEIIKFIPQELTITQNSTCLKEAGIKKQIVKNVPHKILCYHVLSNNKGLENLNISPSTLCKTNEPLEYMEKIKPAIISTAIILMLSTRINYTVNEAINLYSSLSHYYNNSIKCLIADKNDTINRIIHANSTQDSFNDKKLLIKSLKDFINSLNNDTRCQNTSEFLSTNGIGISKDKAIETLDAIIQNL